MTRLEQKDRILRAVARLDAYQRIQNTVGRTIVAFNFRQPERVLSHFALDRDDVWFEYADEGRFVGADAVRALVDLLIGTPARPGEMRDHQLTTPIIEVADDGDSARAVWWVPGAGALVRDDQDPEAIWDWGTLAADLVRDGDEWRILHLHWFRYITCLYVDGWTDDTSLINRPNTAMHPLSQPTTHHNPYHPLSVRDGIPAAPRPHATLGDPDWMLSRDKAV
jgi:hypothetical protein